MNTRNVVASFLCARPPRGAPRRSRAPHAGPADARFGAALRDSAHAGGARAESDSRSLSRWLASTRAAHPIKTRRIPLSRLRDWVEDDEGIHHLAAGEHFAVLGVAVAASNREVARWDQPMIGWPRTGLVGFLCQRKRGVLHFVVQARLEPGNTSGIELAPTLQCTPETCGPVPATSEIPFHDAIALAPPSRTRWRSDQSEEGGRYFRCVNTHVVVEADPGEPVELPPDYAWMTLGQVMAGIRHGGLCNAECRSLVSYLAAAAGAAPLAHGAAPAESVAVP